MKTHRDEARGVEYFVDTRTAEEAAAHEAERDVHRVETLGKLGGAIAYFDEHGVCRAVGDAAWPLDGYAHSSPVKHGTKPGEVTFDPETGKVSKARAASVEIPDAHPTGAQLTIRLPKGVVAEVDGVAHRGSVTLRSDDPKRVPIELHGRQRGSFVVEFQTYRERRAADYPALADQLDALWKGGEAAEAMKAQVMAVKERHAKPDDD